MASKAQSQLRLIAWVAAASLAVPLSMFATWVAISRYPVPDRDSINLGLFLFFLVVLLNVYLVCDLLVSGLREGKPMSFFGLTGIFAVGLLIAAVLGILPWGVDRLTADRPWIAQVSRMALLILQFLVVVRSWRARRQPSTFKKLAMPPQ